MEKKNQFTEEKKLHLIQLQPFDMQQKFLVKKTDGEKIHRFVFVLFFKDG